MAMAVSNQQSRDAALLRATTELFVLEAKHGADEIRRFEELATHFLARVGPADRAFVAEKLSRAADAPASILRLLGRDLLEIASPILKRSPALGEFDMLTIMASTPAQHHRLIAGRTDLTPLVVAALRLTGDAEVVARVAAYPQVMTESEAIAIAPPAEAIEVDEAEEILVAAETEAVVEEAEIPQEAAAEDAEEDETDVEAEADFDDEDDQDDEVVEDIRTDRLTAEAAEIFAAVRAIATSFEARTAARKPEAEPMTPAAFVALDRAARLDLLKQIGSHPAPRHEAMGPIDADHAFRQALGRARLASLARQRQRDALIRTLAQGLRLAENDVAAMLDDPSGEALVVLLGAIGLAEAEAHQVLLFANPVIAAGVESFERLTQLFGETRESVAADLVAAWRSGDRPASRPAHQPIVADLEPRSDARVAAGSSARVQDPPERRVFGLRGS